MPNVEETRRRREEEARKRDDTVRQERLRLEERERVRHKQDLERMRWQVMAKEKQDEKTQANIQEAELKSLQLQASMGDKDAIDKLAQMKKHGLGPAPYTGQDQ
jgi:hypothetical protein